MKVLLIEPTFEHAPVFLRNGWECDNLRTYSGNVVDYDLVCLVGGTDVDPSLYGEEPHPETYATPKQDELVWATIIHSAEQGVPIVGICKGAQQLCVFYGGKLHQHVVGHEGAHPITVEETGEQFHTRGNHHQMMIPPSDAEVLAYAENLSGHFLEPEVVYFPKHNALGFQYHPEWMEHESRGVSYFFETISKYLIKEQ